MADRLLEMGDASTPPVPPANLPVFCVYFGPGTPHDWTDAEVAALHSRWVLPIRVETSPVASPELVAADIIAYAKAHNFRAGETICLDVENIAEPALISEIDRLVGLASISLMTYESKGPSKVNPATSGGRFIADWTGVPHLYPDSVATQYASAEMTGDQWDHSVILASVKLHELHPPVHHVIRYVPVAVQLPVLGPGDHGQAVRRLQHLLLAFDPHCLPLHGPDGIFGPETGTALRTFQRLYGLTAGLGQSTAGTWAELLTG